MKRRLRYLLLILSCLLLPAESALAQIAVVINAKNPVAVLTRTEVMNLFLGRYRQFFNGDEAEPVELFDNHPDRARFYQLLVGKELSDINAYWARLIFSGRVHAISKVGSTEEVLKWVQTHPGGIGFVDSSKVDARVKVVLELSAQK